MTLADLLRLPPAALAATLCAMSEKERKAYAPEMRGRGWRCDEGAHEQHYLLALGLLNGAKQVANAVQFAHLDVGNERFAVDVLRARRPAWLAALPEAFGGDWPANNWRVVRALEREGLVEPPAAEWYATGLATGLCGWAWYGIRPPVLDELRADPELLDRHVWTMLETEGGGTAVANADGALRYADPANPAMRARAEHTWEHAFVTLLGEGRLDRGRMLDTVLGAFLRDWAPASQAWFVDFHATLAPTVEEQAARQETYARVLAAPYGRAVKVAQQAFERLLDYERLDVPVLLAASPAALARPDKGSVMAQLRLLPLVRKWHPAYAAEVGAAARPALDHERADVRDVAATLVPDAAPAPAAEPLADDVPAVRPAPAPVVPVADADELAALFAALVEEAPDPVEVDRAFEGVARLAATRPRHGADALVRRAGERLEERFADGGLFDPRSVLAGLALVWLDGAVPSPRYAGRYATLFWELGEEPPLRPNRTPAAVLTWRAQEVAAVVAAGGGALVSLPATSDGVLPAAVLRERLAALGRAPLPVDAVVAALRVPPAEYAAVPAGRVGDAVAALAAFAPAWERVAFGMERVHRPALRAVAWRAATPPPRDESLAMLLDRRDPVADFAYDMDEGEWTPRFDQHVAQWPLLLPHHPDLLAAFAHPRLARGLRKTRSAGGPLLDALARVPTPATPLACSALALGLALDDGAERTRAVDAVVDLAAYGLLDGAAFGGQVAALLADGVVVGGRVAGSLAEVARVSRSAAGVVLDALAVVLPVLPGRRDAHAFVDLTADVATRLGRTVPLPEEFAALARGRSASVLAAACRRVPS